MTKAMHFGSDAPPVSREFPTLPACLAERRRSRRDAPFLQGANGWLTFGEIGERVDRLAAGFQAAGIGRGDRVALLLPNSLEMCLALLSLAEIGAISLPLNIYLRGDFLHFQLHDGEAAMLVTDEPGFRASAPLLDRLPGLRTIVTTEAAEAPARSGVTMLAFDAVAACDGAIARPDLGIADILTILYTSGTTGMPKACVCSHGYFMAAIVPPIRLGLLLPDDVIITAYPLFHAAGFNFCLIGALVAGAAISIEPSFSASGFMGRARDLDATVALGLGTMAAAIMATPPDPRDRAHRLRYCSWPAAAPEVQEAFEERFGVLVHAAAYGQTEALGLGWAGIDESRANRRTLGRPSPLLEVAIVDEHDERLPSNQTGELVVRPHIPEALFQGYAKRADEQIAQWRNLWHHTGDLCRQDEAGLLFYVDRKKDAIRRRGENVSSVELEAAIRRHPSVELCAAFAVESPLGGDDIKIAIKLRRDKIADAEELFEFFKHNLPYFAVPRYVELVDDFPMTPTGRIRKDQLRQAGIGGAWDLEALGLVLSRAERRA